MTGREESVTTGEDGREVESGKLLKAKVLARWNTCLLLVRTVSISHTYMLSDCFLNKCSARLERRRERRKCRRGRGTGGQVLRRIGPGPSAAEEADSVGRSEGTRVTPTRDFDAIDRERSGIVGVLYCRFIDAEACFLLICMMLWGQPIFH